MFGIEKINQLTWFQFILKIFGQKHKVIKSISCHYDYFTLFSKQSIHIWSCCFLKSLIPVFWGRPVCNFYALKSTIYISNIQYIWITQFNWTQLNPIQLNFAQLDSTQLFSTQLYSIEVSAEEVLPRRLEGRIKDFSRLATGWKKAKNKSSFDIRKA